MPPASRCFLAKLDLGEDMSSMARQMPALQSRLSSQSTSAIGGVNKFAASAFIQKVRSVELKRPLNSVARWPL